MHSRQPSNRHGTRSWRHAIGKAQGLLALLPTIQRCVQLFIEIYSGGNEDLVRTGPSRKRARYGPRIPQGCLISEHLAFKAIPWSYCFTLSRHAFSLVTTHALS